VTVLEWRALWAWIDDQEIGTAETRAAHDAAEALAAAERASGGGRVVEWHEAR
jgi:hypothetical protein